MIEPIKTYKILRLEPLIKYIPKAHKTKAKNPLDI